MIIGTRAKAKVPPMEAGTYLAVCVGIYDLGEQQSEYKGKTRYSNQVLFTFEIPSKTVEIDGEMKPRQLSRQFAVSTSKKSNLRKFISSWTGRTMSDDDFAEFNTDSLLGSAVMIQVVLNETGEYANIDGVMRIPEGIPAPKTETAPVSFDMDKWDDKVFEGLSEWVQEKIRNSTQYQSAHAPETVVDFPEPAASTASAAASTAPAAPKASKTEECPF